MEDVTASAPSTELRRLRGFRPPFCEGCESLQNPRLVSSTKNTVGWRKGGQAGCGACEKLPRTFVNALNNRFRRAMHSWSLETCSRYIGIMGALRPDELVTI
jgi:hypothetical protein